MLALQRLKVVVVQALNAELHVQEARVKSFTAGRGQGRGTDRQAVDAGITKALKLIKWEEGWIGLQRDLPARKK